MHYAILVLIPGAAETKTAVDTAMAPFSEHTDPDHGRWDWFQIGGRWSGRLSGYDPEKDARNIERCDLCEGTGTRRDAIGLAQGMVDRAWCNGCDGKGQRVKWPTQWAAHPGDRSARVPMFEDITGSFHAVVTLDGRWLSHERWDGHDFVDVPWEPDVRDALTEAKAKGAHAVVVDCHS